MINDTLIGQALYSKMEYLDKRHSMTTSNIANANTPRYLEQDLKPYSFNNYLKSHAQSSGSGSINSTNAKHIMSLPNPSSSALYHHHTMYETKMSKNSVVLEEQAQRVNEIQAEHKLINAVYRAQISLYNTALTQPK